jgi:S1-C subfamily serine protease
MAFHASRALAFDLDPLVAKAEKRRVNVIASITPTVVAIFGHDTSTGGGSGVLISPDGFALTNFHVTEGAGRFMRCGLSDGRLYDAVIVGHDPTGDVAMIKLLGRTDFPVARPGDSDAVAVGDEVLVMGNPFLLATDLTPTVTAGIVSGVHRYQYPAGTILEYTDCIQVDASINPGNSGGPLFNADGELIGINGRGSFEKRGRVNVGAGYAISINQITHFMEALRSGRLVDHASLGALVQTRNDGALVISEISESSDAFRRGLRVDDELVEFAGRPLRSVNQFKNILGIYPDGWKLPLVYRRDGEKRTIFVRLAPLHRASELTSPSGLRPPGGPAHPEPKPGTESPAARYFVEKAGFANYYFNQLEQQRMWGVVKRLGDYSTATGTWKIRGAYGDRGVGVWTIAARGAGLSIGESAYFQDAAPGAELLDEPPGTGGLLASIHQFRLLVAVGASAFSDVMYVGAEPLGGVGPRVDVLATQLSNGRARWLFRCEDGAFVGWDFELTENGERCEVRIVEWREEGGRRFPASFTATFGDAPPIPFRWDAVEILPSSPNTASTGAL